MKNNIFGYVFFIFIIGIMAFAIYKFNTSENNKSTDNTAGGSSSISTQKGTKLTLGIFEFDTINPIITKNKKVQEISKLIFDSLVNIDKNGKAIPSLAKEWETSDNKTYIIKLKSGIKWTDGTYFSSDDVIYTINRLKEADKSSIYTENVKYVREVDKIDNTTLRIILTDVVPFYEYYLCFPIVSAKYYDQEDFWNTDKNKMPMSNGRFQITEVTNSTITLSKNKNWWNLENDDSIIETINNNIYSSVAELYNAFKLGSIDLVATDNRNYQEYIGKIGYNTSEIEGRNFIFLALNTKNGILSDVNVRRALRYAINKDEIISKIYGNSYMKATFPISSNNYLVNYSNDNTFNVSEIEINLKKSGWIITKGQWRKTVDYKNVNLELKMVVKKGTKRVDVAKYLRNFLLNQGIVINIIEASNEDYNKYLQSKDYDLILCESTQSIAPDMTTYFGKNNLANFSNNDTNEIMKYLDNVTDENELKTKYQKLYEIFNNEIPYIGIARSKIYVVTNTYLSAQIDSKWYNLFFNFKDWYTS